VAANGLGVTSCPTSYPSGYSTRLAADATVDTFNALGQKVQETSPPPAGQSGYETTSYAYDADGDLIQTTAPPSSNGGASQVTVDTYNSANELASKTSGYGTSAASTVSYCYAPDGSKTSDVYADGNTSGVAACETSSPWIVSSSAYPTQAAYQTTYSYDSAGELVSTTTPATTAAPSGGTTTYTYDPMGNNLTDTDPNGVTATWTYTPLNQAATCTYSGGTAHAVTYSYDASGNRTGMADASGTSSYGYDPFGELTSATNGAGHAISYGYDAAGDLIGITYPLPSTATWATTDTVSYGYDHADELTSATDFNGNAISVGDTADGLSASVQLGSTGDSISTTYDNTDAPSTITLKNSSTTLQSFTYSDSPAGTILSETDTPSSAQSPADYAYDAQGRVTSDTPGSSSAESYSFDASGNLTTLPIGATATYDDAGELKSSALRGATTSYTYNADGEQLTSVQGATTDSTATWNGTGQLSSYDNSAADMTMATYDGNGLRTSTAITPSGGSAVTQGYIWNNQPTAPQLLMDSANAYIYTTGTAPVEQVNLTTGATTYLVTDLLGSVRGIVSSTGALTATTAYDAWGNPETAGGLTAATPFGYAGAYTDPDGLIYLINRYYEPSTGQFISVDPAVSQTLEPYAYTLGNPVTETDPTGLSTLLQRTSTWAFENVFSAPYRFGDDCADFVSESLQAGGYLFDGDPEDGGHGNYDWYYHPGGIRQGPHYTFSWSVAEDLAQHLLLTGSKALPYYNSGVQDGDIIFANWSSSNFYDIDHAGVVTGVSANGQPLITQHSPSQRNVTLNYWLTHGGPNVHVWIIKPVQD
jgi:RHS repeat-associated protein